MNNPASSNSLNENFKSINNENDPSEGDHSKSCRGLLDVKHIDDADLDALLDEAEEMYRKEEELKEQYSLNTISTSNNEIQLPSLKSGLEDPSLLYINPPDKDGLSVTRLLVSTTEDSEKAIEKVQIQNVVVKKPSKKQLKETREATLGPKWFDMPAVTMTPEIKRDLQIIKLRNVLDPKRFYKRSDGEIGVIPGKKSLKKGELEKRYFQVGTIIEGPHEYFSSRLTKKEKKNTIAEEIMADTERKQYLKRKVTEIHIQRSSGGKSHLKAKQSKKQRR